MKIQIEEEVYEGTGTEIMEQLRMQVLDPNEYPDTDSYITQRQNDFIRLTDIECELPVTGTEARAKAMLYHWAKIGALVFLEDSE